MEIGLKRLPFISKPLIRQPGPGFTYQPTRLHKEAERLLAVCDYLWKFIGDVKLGET